MMTPIIAMNGLILSASDHLVVAAVKEAISRDIPFLGQQRPLTGDILFCCHNGAVVLCDYIKQDDETGLNLYRGIGFEVWKQEEIYSADYTYHKLDHHRAIAVSYIALAYAEANGLVFADRAQHYDSTRVIFQTWGGCVQWGNPEVNPNSIEWVMTR
jgi:hypothetical protein